MESVLRAILILIIVGMVLLMGVLSVYDYMEGDKRGAINKGVACLVWIVVLFVVKYV